mmetsp:Transcript_9504/g.31167  ORF Transcript_9504/g.31167 Transcript_9504/m.31167 type:complete len:285 (+) Transcript_9504:236-1090(+)
MFERLRLRLEPPAHLFPNRAGCPPVVAVQRRDVWLKQPHRTQLGVVSPREPHGLGGGLRTDHEDAVLLLQHHVRRGVGVHVWVPVPTPVRVDAAAVKTQHRHLPLMQQEEEELNEGPPDKIHRDRDLARDRSAARLGLPGRQCARGPRHIRARPRPPARARPRAAAGVDRDRVLLLGQQRLPIVGDLVIVPDEKVAQHSHDVGVKERLTDDGVQHAREEHAPFCIGRRHLNLQLGPAPPVDRWLEEAHVGPAHQLRHHVQPRVERLHVLVGENRICVHEILAPR